MAIMSGDENNPAYRAFVCHTLNEWSYPAKDRSGRLDLIEEPHLGKLLQKMSGNKPLSDRPLNFDLAKRVFTDIHLYKIIRQELRKFNLN